jgi:hypothetical protein
MPLHSQLHTAHTGAEEKHFGDIEDDTDLTSTKGSSKGKRKSKKAAAAGAADDDTASRMRSGNSDDEEAGGTGGVGRNDDDDGDAPGGDALAPGDIAETAVDQDGEKDIDFDQVCAC